MMFKRKLTASIFMDSVTIEEKGSWRKAVEGPRKTGGWYGKAGQNKQLRR
jgi:hypothetical protein